MLNISFIKRSLRHVTRLNWYFADMLMLGYLYVAHVSGTLYNVVTMSTSLQHFKLNIKYITDKFILFLLFSNVACPH